MSATTPFVGVRVFSDLSKSLARIDTRDSTVIAMVMPAPAADTGVFPANTCVRVPTNDPEIIADLGAGLAQDAIAQIASEGIVADVIFVRTAHSAEVDPTTKLEAEISATAGNAALKTGMWALLNAEAELGIYPGIVISPGYTAHRSPVKAAGKITFASQPAADTTVTIAGTAVTFKATGAAGNQVNIGANLAATLTALAAFLNGSADAGLASVDYTATATELNLLAHTGGTAGNSIAYATTVAGATAAGATLTGGAPTAANAVAAAMDGVCSALIDCIAICDTPTSSREDAADWAADFATSLNIVAMYPAALVDLGSGTVTRPLSPHVAAATVRRDKEAGNPFKAAWNRPLRGILGVSKPVGYIDGEITSDANYLVQRGVGTVIEGKLLWAPFTTATDPTVNTYRSIKRIRTRRAIEKAMLRPMRKYLSEDITPHMVTLIFLSLDEYLGDLKVMGALVDYEVLWSPSMNPASVLEAGAIRVKCRFAETPDLVDLQIYTEPQPEAFDALALAIAAAINTLGRPNIRVAA